MAWSKVSKGKKPVLWWYHKIMCELGYLINDSHSRMYYHHLNKCCELGFNLYGEVIPEELMNTFKDSSSKK